MNDIVESVIKKSGTKSLVGRKAIENLAEAFSILEDNDIAYMFVESKSFIDGDNVTLILKESNIGFATLDGSNFTRIERGGVVTARLDSEGVVDDIRGKVSPGMMP